jgi:cation diffusion facilitator CzcD-associated flavoprotein CzcO
VSKPELGELSDAEERTRDIRRPDEDRDRIRASRDDRHRSRPSGSGHRLSPQRKAHPSFADELAPDITQFHSSDYRNPTQLQKGETLVVGAGNSGAEIAMEVARDHPTWMSGPDTG